MANRFGREYREPHDGSDPFGMPPRMKREPYRKFNPPQAPREIWRDTQKGSWLNPPTPNAMPNPHSNDDVVRTNVEDNRSKGPKKLSSLPWQAEGPDDNYKDYGGGSKVPRKPKPNKPSGGMKKPIPTKASK